MQRFEHLQGTCCKIFDIFQLYEHLISLEIEEISTVNIFKYEVGMRLASKSFVEAGEEDKGILFEHFP